MPAKMKAAAPKPKSSRQTLLSEIRALTHARDRDKKCNEHALRKLQADKEKELTRIDKVIAAAAKKSAATVKRCDRIAAQLATAHAKTNQALSQRIAILESRLSAL